MRKCIIALARAIALVALTGTAAAPVALAQADQTGQVDYSKMRADERVQSELLAASMAYLIDERCARIRLRRLKLVGYALSLNRHAKGLGYTRAEVEAYVNDRDEQARFREMAEARLEEKGADPADPESYCAVGRAEIERGTYLGSMLKGG